MKKRTEYGVYYKGRADSVSLKSLGLYYDSRKDAETVVALLNATPPRNIKGKFSVEDITVLEDALAKHFSLPRK